MHEFQTFVYLGMQKTGTTFVSDFLNRFSTEKSIVHEPHRPVGLETDLKKFFFISVRDPLDAYLSLYSYGSEAKGRMRNNFVRDGIEKNFYDGTMDGFREWLNYVLRPKNAAQLDKPYAHMGGGHTCEMIGFQSWRYLRLALATPSASLAKCRTEDDVRALYKSDKLPRAIIRYENFIPDLVALVRGPLAYAISDVDAAVKFLETAPPMNASDRIDRYATEIFLEKRLARRLLEREWFLHEEFGY
ncbi:MAG TPA: hypothetical protein VMF58_12880 [Rhizomicrobium sp.]|nr:hypothetical protein [Rhizomicrobium sp.]